MFTFFRTSTLPGTSYLSFYEASNGHGATTITIEIDQRNMIYGLKYQSTLGEI